MATAAALVQRVGGEITHELGIINAVAAKLDDAQRDALQASGAITQISADGAVTTAGGTAGTVVLGYDANGTDLISGMGITVTVDAGTIDSV